MKLREYLEALEPGEELTCWDDVVDSEFYFYAKAPEEEPDEDEVSQAYDAYMDKLAAMLDIVEERDDGVVVNLYDLLEHPAVIQFAKDNLYSPRQYGNDEELLMLLFDDNDSNISNGFFHFSQDMVQCLEQAYGPAGEKYSIDQIKALEKEVDGPEHLRASIAEMGIALERFVKDESWLVRAKVAANGYGLDVLVNDPHWAVRKAVARQGFGLETLVQDDDWRVRDAAQSELKRKAYVEEMSAKAAEREDGIEEYLRVAFERSEETVETGLGKPDSGMVL